MPKRPWHREETPQLIDLIEREKDRERSHLNTTDPFILRVFFSHSLDFMSIHHSVYLNLRS